MPSTTFYASSMRYYHAGSWVNGQARQGFVDSWEDRGEIWFDFSSQIDTSNIDITSMYLSFTVGSLGGAYTKYVYFRTGNYNGTSVENFKFTSFLNTTKGKTLNAGSYASAFSKMKEYIEAGGNKFGVWTGGYNRGGASGKSYNYDYMNITGVSLTLEYDYKQSSGSISSAYTGSPAVLTITPYNETYSHRMTWALGTNSDVTTVSAGITSASYTIPHSWLPNSESGIASVTLDTLDSNGNSLGSNTYNFTVTVPSNVVPTIGSITSSPQNNGASSTAAAWGLYIQNKTKALVSINNAAAGSGASISSYSITSSPNFGSSTSSSLTSNLLSSSGTVTFTGKVIDSRGRSTTSTLSITVYGYSAPVFTSTPSCFRCISTGAQDDIAGTYASVLASFSCSSVNGNNSLTVRKATLNYIDTTITSGIAAVIGAGALSLDSSYQIIITLTDIVGSTTTYSLVVPSATYVFHIRKGGKSLGIGRAAGTTDDSTVHVGWTLSLDNALGIGSGGTGLSSSPSMLTNLGTTSAANVLQASPRPGVTGTLGVGNGGTGQTSLQATRNAMGLGDTTGALPVANGGTGASTALAARANLGAALGNYTNGEEVDTGGKWTNGNTIKTIYRYVCSGDISGTGVVSTGYSLPRTPGMVLDIHGACLVSGTWEPIPHVTYYNLNLTIGAVMYNEKDISLFFGSSVSGTKTYFLVIDYTD